ncbi:unnamed protein product [Rangifer tarandus platyrhynchus]|uniref:Uncharacterized protein n=1 Tax=Rangifer tarandus platyrhynchus TaxID=3082113 RepID=A0AC59Z3Y2_RANTA
MLLGRPPPGRCGSPRVQVLIAELAGVSALPQALTGLCSLRTSFLPGSRVDESARPLTCGCLSSVHVVGFSCYQQLLNSNGSAQRFSGKHRREALNSSSGKTGGCVVLASCRRQCVGAEAWKSSPQSRPSAAA